MLAEQTGGDKNQSRVFKNKKIKNKELCSPDSLTQEVQPLLLKVEKN